MMQRIQYLSQLLESSPRDGFLLFAMAKEYEGAGNDAEALGFYLRLLEADPAYTGLYYHLGKLYERSQQTEKAIETYRAGIVVCRQVSDRHAMSELQGALDELTD